MVRLNLSTRPFYNERALHLGLALVALALAVVTVINAREILTLSSRQTALEQQISTDEARTTELRQRAARMRAELRQEELEIVLARAREANELIDRRTFSWTELFNQLETALPSDVMLTSVQPQVGKDGFLVTLGVVGRQEDDIDAFMERLEKTGAFSEVLSGDETAQDDGTVKAMLTGKYGGARAVRAAGQGAGPDAVPAAPAGGATPEARR
jgi:type IV pilus assembly protein PilN